MQVAGRIDNTKRVLPAQGEQTSVFAEKPVDKDNKVMSDNEVASPHATATDKSALESAVANINQFVQNIQRELHFSVEQESSQVVILVRDSSTQEVIRQIPSEDALKLARTLRDAQGVSGHIFNGKA